MAYEPSLLKTLKTLGGPTKLARLLEIQPSAVTQWSRIPAERVPVLSRLTGIPRHELRPDLWEAPAPTPSHATPTPRPRVLDGGAAARVEETAA